MDNQIVDANKKALKPCPFCGLSEYLIIKAIESFDPDYVEDHIICTMCGARVLLNDCLGWSNRPIEDAQALEIHKGSNVINELNVQLATANKRIEEYKERHRLSMAYLFDLKHQAEQEIKSEHSGSAAVQLNTSIIIMKKLEGIPLTMVDKL